MEDLEAFAERLSRPQRAQIIEDAKHAARLTIPTQTETGGRPRLPTDAMFAAFALRLFLDCTFAGLNAHLKRHFPERYRLFGDLRRLPHPTTHRNFALSLSPDTLKSFLDNLRRFNPGLVLIIELRLELHPIGEKTLNCQPENSVENTP